MWCSRIFAVLLYGENIHRVEYLCRESRIIGKKKKKKRYIRVLFIKF